MRTIRVIGKGDLTVRPDTARLTITLTDVYKEYAEAVNASNTATKILKKLVVL